MKQPIKTPLIEILVGWATLGFLLLWILEFRRTHFQQSYWLLMLFTASLLGYILLRYKRVIATKSTTTDNALEKRTKLKNTKKS